MFCLATIALGTKLKWIQMMFIGNRNSPRGAPPPCLGSQSSLIRSLCYVAHVVSPCAGSLTDVGELFFSSTTLSCLAEMCGIALSLPRVRDHRYWIIVLPGIVFLGTICNPSATLVFSEANYVLCSYLRCLAPDNGSWLVPSTCLGFGDHVLVFVYLSKYYCHHIDLCEAVSCTSQNHRHFRKRERRALYRIDATLVESAAFYSIWGWPLTQNMRASRFSIFL